MLTCAGYVWGASAITLVCVVFTRSCFMHGWGHESRSSVQELHMTGCAVITDGIAAVVAEGGPKALKRYAKVMLQRINWAALPPGDEGGSAPEPPEGGLPAGPGAVLVWTGVVRERAFDKFVTHECRTEAAARQFLTEHGIGHYWDLAQAHDQAAA